MKRSLSAILVALFITACVAGSIFAVGGAALLNKNGVVSSNSTDQGSVATDSVTGEPISQVDQLQNLVSQYQDREQQYQQREQQLQQELTQANAQIQQDQQMIGQFQNLLTALQQRGVIRVTSDGRVFINQ